MNNKGMDNTVNVEKELKTIAKKLNNFLSTMDEGKNILKESYKEACELEECYGKDDLPKKYSEEGFEDAFQRTKKYIKRNVEFIEDIISPKQLQFSSLSKHMENVRNECIEQYDNLFHDDCVSLVNNIDSIIDCSVEFAAIKLLNDFAEIDENMIIIGGNGSGKTTLINALKAHDYDFISIIPAQRLLFYYNWGKASFEFMDVQSSLLENSIERSRRSYDDEFIDYQKNEFSLLVSAALEEHFIYLANCHEKDERVKYGETRFDILKEVFEATLPGLKIYCGKQEYGFTIIRDGDEYYLNSLSDGEKAVIYYTLSVLFAKEKSIIVIDEPENHLNPAIANELWMRLIKQRNDCRFIFITHSHDFANAIFNTQLIWIKEYQYPNYWDCQRIDDNYKLPRELITELLGSKKPIVFCEGEKSSIDYRVYSSLLGDKYTIIPVGVHMDVINTCQAVKKSGLLSEDCFGIIDGDNRTEERNTKLRGRGVYSLPFNEIEMFLLSDQVMLATMKKNRPRNYKKHIVEFKNHFWNVAKDRDKEMALEYTRIKTNNYFETQKVSHFDTIEQIEADIHLFSNYDARKTYEKKLREIKKTIKNKDYKKLLTICNLKGDIIGKLANDYLSTHYKEEALKEIACNNKLQDLLLKEYFRDLIEAIRKE